MTQETGARRKYVVKRYQIEVTETYHRLRWFEANSEEEAVKMAGEVYREQGLAGFSSDGGDDAPVVSFNVNDIDGE